MDSIDLQIISILRKNSRVSFRKIAQQTGLSTDTIIKRYEKLEKEKIIQPTIKVDYEKLGYQGILFFFIRIKGGSDLELILNEIGKIPDVIGIVTASGLYDIMAIGCVRNVEHAFEIGKEIKKVVNVVKVTLDLLWRQPKGEATFPPNGWDNFLR